MPAKKIGARRRRKLRMKFWYHSALRSEWISFAGVKSTIKEISATTPVQTESFAKRWLKGVHNHPGIRENGLRIKPHRTATTMSTTAAFSNTPSGRHSPEMLVDGVRLFG